MDVIITWLAKKTNEKFVKLMRVLQVKTLRNVIRITLI
jgi:hypothetical protein